MAGQYHFAVEDTVSSRPFVARVTPQGNQRWFRLLGLPEERGTITHLVARPNGGVVAAGTSGFVFELSADGVPRGEQP